MLWFAFFFKQMNKDYEPLIRRPPMTVLPGDNLHWANIRETLNILK